MKHHNYYFYISTNPRRTTLYIGVTNNLGRRLIEHFDNSGNSKTFAGRYYCYNLVYWEKFDDVVDAIHREKEVKAWNRDKKITLIKSVNPKFIFLNKDFE